MNLGELIVELSLDSAQFTQELDKVKTHSTVAVKNLEKSLNKGFNLKINASSLDKFNKSLDTVLQKYNNITQYFKSNSIVVNVDKTKLDELNKALNNTKRKVNIQTELSSISKQESKKVGEDVVDGFVEGAKTIKSKKKAITEDFKSIITDIKGVFDISSPSKVMQAIGLDVGKGFQDGVVASMLLASKRISEAYEKTLDKIIKNPKATQTQKQSAQNLKGEVQKELELYARLIREDRMPFPQEQKEEAKKIFDKAQQNAKKVGMKPDEIKSIAQSAKQEAERIINPPKSKSEVSDYKEFKKEFLLVFHELLEPGESDVRIYQLRRELEKRGKVTNRKTFDSYYLDLLNDEELDPYHYNAAIHKDFVDRTKHPVGKPLPDVFKYDIERFDQAINDSFFPAGSDLPKTYIKLGSSFDLDEYVAKNKSETKASSPQVAQEVAKEVPKIVQEVVKEVPKVVQQAMQQVVKEVVKETVQDIPKIVQEVVKETKKTTTKKAKTDTKKDIKKEAQEQAQKIVEIVQPETKSQPVKDTDPVKSYEEFKKEFLLVFHELLKPGESDVRIYQLRRELEKRGKVTNKEDFNKYFRELAGDEEIDPTPYVGELFEFNHKNPKEYLQALEDSYDIGSGEQARTFVKLSSIFDLDEYIAKNKPKPTSKPVAQEVAREVPKIVQEVVKEVPKVVQEAMQQVVKEVVKETIQDIPKIVQEVVKETKKTTKKAKTDAKKDIKKEAQEQAQKIVEIVQPETKSQPVKDTDKKAKTDTKKDIKKEAQEQAQKIVEIVQPETKSQPVKDTDPVKSYEEFKKEFLLVFHKLLKPGESDVRIYQLRRELEKSGKVTNKEDFNKYFRELAGDEELDPTPYVGELFEFNHKNPKEYLQALEDSYDIGSGEQARTFVKLSSIFDLDEYIAKNKPKPTSKPVAQEIIQQPIQVVQESAQKVVEQTKTANRTAEDIFKDIASISKDAVTILQKYGSDISAIPARNTKQIKEVSKAELSGLIKELKETGFGVTEKTKTSKSKTQNIETPAPITEVQESAQKVVEQAKTANRTAEDIFKDIASISKDAVTILQKYGSDISAIPARNTKQIKEVSKAELSGLIKELKETGFGVTEKTKTSKSKTQNLVTTTYGKKQAKILNEVPLMGQDVVSGLSKGLDGVEDIGEKTAEKFIKAFKAELDIRSPSLLMIEMGLMVVSGLALGLQKGDSRIAKGARKVVETLTNTLKPIKEIADPVLGAAGAIPALSSAATYGSAALNVTDTGLKILTKVGERHAEGVHTYATDQTLFHAIGGSIKDLVTGIASDETLNMPREAFDHVINIAKAGALGLGASPSDMTSFDAAQAGATALLRNSAIMKAIAQSHQQTRAKKDADPSINYLATFKDVLVDNLKGLELSKGEVLKALGSAMKVVPTGIGTAAEGNFGIAGEVFSNAPDALVPVLDVYRKVKARKSEGESTKEAVASSLTELGLPSPVAGAIGSAANKLNPQLKGFVAVGKNINEGISKGVLNTVSLTTTAIEFTGNAIQKQIKENMRISSPSRVMMVIGTFIGKGLMIGLQQSIQANGVVKDLVAELTDDLSQDVPNIPKNKRTKPSKSKAKNIETPNIEKDFEQIGVNSIDAFAAGIVKQSKAAKTRVKKFFTEIVDDVKGTLQIQSPSKLMQNIGLNFGKGFESGAVASLTLSSKRISDAYKNIVEKIINDPSVSQAQKQALAASKNQIDADLQKFANDYAKNKFASESDAMKELAKIYSKAKTQAQNINQISGQDQIDIVDINKGVRQDIQESQEENYSKILGNLFDSFAQQDLGRFVMNLEKAFEPFQDFITFDIGNLFEYFQGMVDMAIQSLQQLTDMMVQMESIQKKLDYLGGSKAGGAKEMGFALATANEFRVPAEAAANAYAQLSLAAQDTKLEGRGVQNLFKGISASISALGLSSEDAEGAFMAYTQMLSKGKISMEELRQQLSERFPPAMGIFSKALNVTAAELNELASQGALLSDITLSKVADILLAEYGNAARGIQGVGMSLTAVSNSLFTIASKITNSFSGLFSTVIDVFGSIVKFIEGSFDSIVKIVGLAAGAMVVAISGTLLGVLSKIPALQVALVSFIGLIKTSFISALGIIVAGMPGIIAVLLDGFLSAENSIASTLTKSVQNFVGFVSQMVDGVKRNLTGTGIFEVNIGESKSNSFQGIIDSAAKFFNMIPKGIIQMVALVAIFQQLRGLAISTGIFSSIAPAIAAVQALATKFFISMSAGFAGIKAGAISFGKTLLTSVGSALKSLAALGVQAVLALAVMTLAKSDFSNSMQDAVNTMASNINTSLSTIKQSFNSIEESVNNASKSTGNLSTGVKSVVDAIPSKGLQLDIMYVLGFKSKGYTTDDQIKSINRALATQDKDKLDFREEAAYNMQMSKLSIEARAKNIAELRKQQTEARNKGDKELVDNLEKRIKNNYSFSPFLNRDIDKLLNSPAVMQSQEFRNKIAKQEAERLKALGLSEDQIKVANTYFKGTDIVRSTDSQVAEGVKQALDMGVSLSKRLEEAKNITKNMGLDSPANYLKTAGGATKKAIEDIKQIDLKIAGLGIERFNAVAANDLTKINKIDKQIQSLQKDRESKVQPFKDQLSAAQAISKEADAFAQKLEELGIPITGELRKAIDEMKALGKQAEDTIKKSVPVNVFDSIFQTTVGALKRLEEVFERFSKTVESASAKRQYLIYSNANTPGDVDFASKQSAIIEAEDRLLSASAQYEAQNKAFRILSLVPESNQSDATKTQIEETRKNRLQAEIEVNNAKGNLAKSRYDLNRSIIEQNRQIEEFIRNAEKETIGVKNEFEKASLDLKAMRMKTRISESLAGVVDDGVVSFINSVVSIFEQVNNAVKQQMDAEARIAELGFRRQEIELENAKFRESLPSTDLMDLLVKTRGDIRELTTAFTEENKKFDDIGNKIIKQGQNLASGLGLANTQAKEIYRQFANMLAPTESLNLSTKQFKDNLEGARKAAEETSKILKNLNGTTSGDNGAKPVASNMSDANKDSKLLAQNVNNLTSPLTSISSAVLQMRNNFRDSATYTAQIKDNVNNTNTKDGKPSTLPGNTKLPMPTASNNNENQYAINYGLGNLIASAGVSDIGNLLPSPTLLVRRRETREERANRLFRIYLKKDPNQVYEKTAGHAFSVLPSLQRDMPNIGNILLGEDYRRLSPEDQAFRRIDLIRSATKSDLLAISNTRHLLAIQKTINELAAAPQTPTTIKALNELTHARYLAQRNINEPYNDKGQDEPFRQIIGLEKLLQIPEFKSNNDRYHNEYLTEFKRYVKRGEENPVFGTQRKLAIAEGYEASTKERTWFDKIMGAFDKRRQGFRELYLLQREAKQYGPPTPVPITPATSVPPALPSKIEIRKNPSALVIPTTPVQPVVTAGVPGAIETRQEIPNIQESTAVTQAAQSIEAIMQALNNAKTEIEKRRNDLSISSTNQGGVSDVIDQARKDARALLQRFSANPEKVIESDYSENIASINKAIAQAKINVNTSNNKLKALETFLEEGLPALFAPVNQLINKLPDGEQKNNLLALLNQYKQQQTDVTTQIIAQAKLDIAEAQKTYDELLKEKKALEEGAKKIRVSAQTKLDAERKQQERDFRIKENNAEIQRLESIPTYQFDAEAQRKVAELKYRNAWMQAQTDREKEKIGLLEKGLGDPVFREGTQGYKDALQQIENTFNNTMLAARNNQQTALYNAVTTELGKVTKDKLLASISAPNQYRDSLLDIEQFRQDKIKELTASPFFALREQKDESGKPTEEAVKQLNEFNTAMAALTTEVERRTDDLKLKEKDRVANLLNEAKITRLEAVKSRGGEVFTINADIRRMKEEEAQRRFNERVRNIPKPSLDSTGEEVGKYKQEMQAARQTYENELENIRRSFETLGEAIKNTAITTGLQTLKDELSGLVMNDLIIGFDGATGKTRDLSNELKGFERVLYNVTKAVLSAITKIVIDAAVNKLFGKDGWFDLTRIFGAAQGGVVPNYAEGGAIGKAMQKERSQNGGINPVLAVLTPGERVLTVDQNRKFEALQLQRFLTPSAVGPEELAYRKIKNYAMGGVVGMDSSLQISNTYSKDQSNTSTTINVPVTVENTGNSNNSQLDANSLQNAVRSAVLTEIQRQQRIGGILRK